MQAKQKSAYTVHKYPGHKQIPEMDKTAAQSNETFKDRLDFIILSNARKNLGEIFKFEIWEECDEEKANAKPKRFPFVECR